MSLAQSLRDSFLCCHDGCFQLLPSCLPCWQERAPGMLFNRCGEVHLSWIITVSQAQYRGRLGLSDQQYHDFVREWPRSEEGRRLLEGLRWAAGAGWLLPLAAFGRRLMLVRVCKPRMAYLHGLTRMPRAAA